MIIMWPFWLKFDIQEVVQYLFTITLSFALLSTDYTIIPLSIIPLYHCTIINHHYTIIPLSIIPLYYYQSPLYHCTIIHYTIIHYTIINYTIIHYTIVPLSIIPLSVIPLYHYQLYHYPFSIPKHCYAVGKRPSNNEWWITLMIWKYIFISTFR